MELESEMKQEWKTVIKKLHSSRVVRCQILHFTVGLISSV